MLPVVYQMLTVFIFLVNVARCQITSTWDSSRFIGYYVAPESIEPLLAANAWVTSGTYAGDCNTSGRCPLATECSDNRLKYDDGTVLTCGGGVSCVKATIYATSPAGLPSAVNYGCRMNWQAYTIYRELPATTTSSSLLTSATPTPALVPTDSTITSIAVSILTSTSIASTTSVAVPPTAPNPTTQQQGKSWIAGAVVGLVFFIALVIGAIYRWRRRARETVKAVELDGQSQSYPHFQQYHEKDSDGQLVELPSSRQPVELETYGLR